MPRKKKSSAPSYAMPLLILALLLAAFAVYAYTRFRPVSVAEIFAVTPVTRETGPATLFGLLVKDVPANTPGNFLLILPDSHPVLLDMQDLDHLIGTKVEVFGWLYSSSDNTPSFMRVNKITSTTE